MTTIERPVPVPLLPVAAPAPVRLALPGRTLLVVAGMPGAGKSTLLAGLPRVSEVAVLDSEQQRTTLARRWPGVPYRRYRPLVHLRHRLALVRAARSRTRTVVVHLPATAAATRAALALLAALTGRTAHLLWLDVEPVDALRGQRDRGRMVPSRSFAGHARRGEATRTRLRVRAPRGFAHATVLDRAEARAGLVLDTGPAQ